MYPGRITADFLLIGRLPAARNNILRKCRNCIYKYNESADNYIEIFAYRAGNNIYDRMVLFPSQLKPDVIARQIDTWLPERLEELRRSKVQLDIKERISYN